MGVIPGSLVLVLCLASFKATAAWGGSEKVLLRDVNVLTLHSGGMTTGRRSSPVSQLNCVGGTAGCHSYIPQTVQCYNRGSDGYDIQWECKADMDNLYRFGKVEVTCEGYDHPDDQYILKGSCGLEYTLELTQEGHQKKHAGSHSHGGYQQSHHNSYQNSHNMSKRGGSSWFGDIIFIVIVGGIIYAVYRTCVANTAPSSTYDPPPPYPGDRGTYGRGGAPPPPGFRDEYMPGSGGGCSSSYDSSSQHHRAYSTNTGTGTGGGGFWTGAATGGLLGYMFGSRGSNRHHYYQPNNGWGTGWGSGSTWGSGSSWGSGGTGFSTGGGSSSTSSGTRTASGFGGTKRR